MDTCVKRLVAIGVTATAILTVHPVARGDDGQAKESAARIGHLIKLLASRNQAPKIKGDASLGDDPEIRFGAQYDRLAQVPVYLALNQLLAEGEGAFDLLLQHERDQRYSFSVNSYHDYNVSVGQACQMIVERNILCFEPEIEVITRSQFGLYPPANQLMNTTFAEWWSANKARGLAAIQIEAIDTTIAFMKEVDGATALPWHPAAERLPIEEFDRIRDKNLRTLKAIRDLITTTGKPYTAKSLEGHVTYLFGLPWTGRKHNK